MFTCQVKRTRFRKSSGYASRVKKSEEQVLPSNARGMVCIFNEFGVTAWSRDSGGIKDETGYHTSTASGNSERDWKLSLASPLPLPESILLRRSRRLKTNTCGYGLLYIAKTVHESLSNNFRFWEGAYIIDFFPNSSKIHGDRVLFLHRSIHHIRHLRWNYDEGRAGSSMYTEHSSAVCGTVKITRIPLQWCYLI